MKRLFKLMVLLGVGITPLIMTSCGDDEAAPQVVTQVILVFTPTSGEGTETLSFTYRGDALDQNILTKDDIVLNKTTVYDVDLLMQSEIGVSPINLTGQIKEEAEEWQIFYKTIAG